jgi:TolB-like protein/Tfp pilus assembly protein PilF
MSSLIEGYNYDIFISYRQKDNKYDGWVTEFVENLKKELEATFKEEITVYFDINPHDGLLETHDVGASLKDKLNCFIFIPIISQTYCDSKSFAWQQEFVEFNKLAKEDKFGREIKLSSGNVTSRILPIKINDLDSEDKTLLENELGGVLRSIEFIYKSAGVNRPLRANEDHPQDNLNKTYYRDQINKVANTVKEIITAIKKHNQQVGEVPKEVVISKPEPPKKLNPKVIIASFCVLSLIAFGYFFFPKILKPSELILNIARRGNIIKPEMIQSLVILPFDNFTGDEKLDYFVSGMHSSLISDVGKIGSLTVISETTSNVYKNAHKSLPQIASELKVDAVVEAQVMCLGDSICLQVRVVKADKKEKQLWIGDYKEERSKILGLYNRITKQIADEVMVKLSPEEERLLSKSRIVDRQVYDAYLNSKSYWGDFSRDSLNKALKFLNNAIEKDPGWAPLYDGLANVWMGIQQNGFESPSVTSQKVYENLNKALELDPDLSDSHYISGMMAYLIEWSWEKGEKELSRALAINPNDVFSRIFYAQLLSILQRPDEALKQGQLAIKLDPSNPSVQSLYSALLTSLGDCKGGLTYAEKVVAADPKSYLGNSALEAAAFQCKDYEKVIKAVKYSFPINIEENAFKEIEKIFYKQGFAAAFKEIMPRMESFASSNPVGVMDMAMRYIYTNLPDKALDWLEKGYEIHDPTMPYIATRCFNLDPLFTNPRFLAIVKKMNLPLPKNN